MARDDDHRARKGVPYDETRDLIASSKVEGTPVYGRDDQRLGTVKALMIDKVEGQVRYAVLSHATGFLGLDEEVVPVRWDELRYDERRGGYRVDFTSEDVAYTLENRRRGRAQGRNLDREAPRR
jgi:sporulation protein YlmC with PRC-barrel domain